MIPWLVAAGISFVVSLSVGPFAVARLRRRGTLDYPTARSSHSVPTPRGGGLLVAAGVTAGAGSLALIRMAWVAPVVGGAGTYALLGLAEDMWGIPVRFRLALQIVLAAGSTSWLLSDGAFSSPIWAALAVIASMAWMVGYVNAFNFMDGINGMSVGQAVVAGGAWTLIGSLHHDPMLVDLAALMVGSAIGFAPFNVPVASCFLGDVGSYGLGALIAGGAVVGVLAGFPPEAVFASLMVYLADTSSTILSRFRRGEVWYHPHRSHVYQRLVQAGWSHASTSAFVAGVMTVCSALGLVALGESVPARVIADLAILGVLGLYLASPKLARPVGGNPVPN